MTTPRPSREAREERRRAEKRLSTEYGFPPPRRRSSARTDAIAAVLVLLAVAVVLVGPESFAFWRPFLESGMPRWWVPLALLTGAALLIAAGRMRR